MKTANDNKIKESSPSSATAGSAASLIAKWRAASESLIEKYNDIKNFDGSAASRMLTKAMTLSECADDLENKMQPNAAPSHAAIAAKYEN